MSFMKQMSAEDEIIARRAAREIEVLSSGGGRSIVVNLGIGLPTFIPRVLPPNLPVHFHSENGFVGMGAPLEKGTPDSNTIDAGGRAVALEKGAACFDSLMSFSLVRAGRLDLAVLGAFEISLDGDLANWMIPGKLTPGMGGGMELAQKARRVMVVSRHLDKKGQGKLVEKCTLPLTAAGCVAMLVTERAVFRCIDKRMMLTSIHPDHSRESALEGMPASLEVSDKLEAW